MGSYTSQVQYEDRWKIVHYVRTLQGTAASDSTASDSAAVLNVVPKDPAAPAVKGKGNGK